MPEKILERYGTVTWFETSFKSSNDDPWGHNWRGIEQYRYDLIIKLIKKHIRDETKTNNERKVLDIGCTTGDFTNRLYELNKNAIGIDISETAIKRARTKFKYIDFRIDSLPKSRFQNNTFDLITCLEVIYYVDKDTQRTFLCEINSLLKRKGTAIITSLIGEKPYFKSKELIDLLLKHFELKAVEYYGSRSYSRFEGIIFKRYQQINKIQRLLTLNCHELEKEFNNANNRKKRLIENIVYFVIKFRSLKFITNALLQFLKYKIRAILGWKFPAKLFHFISEKLSLGRTHTLVLVSKK